MSDNCSKLPAFTLQLQPGHNMKETRTNKSETRTKIKNTKNKREQRLKTHEQESIKLAPKNTNLKSKNKD